MFQGLSTWICSVCLFWLSASPSGATRACEAVMKLLLLSSYSVVVLPGPLVPNGFSLCCVFCILAQGFSLKTFFLSIKWLLATFYKSFLFQSDWNVHSTHFFRQNVIKPMVLLLLRLIWATIYKDSELLKVLLKVLSTILWKVLLEVLLKVILKVLLKVLLKVHIRTQ